MIYVMAKHFEDVFVGNPYDSITNAVYASETEEQRTVYTDGSEESVQ